MDVDEVYAQLEFPPDEPLTSVQPDEGRFLHQWVKRHALKRTLEIGFAYGGSAACILSAHGGSHTCIDPYQELYQDLGLRNMEKLGFRERLRFIREPSHVALPQLLAEKQQFDFAFIDGDHRYDTVALDFFYVDLLMESNGFVFLHDTWMRSTQSVARFIETNRRDYTRVACPMWNIVAFQKTGTDDRAWDHFVEFHSWTDAARTRLGQSLSKLRRRIFASR